MRLCNPKTRTETGLEKEILELNVYTPYGKRMLKAMQPFAPGQEEELNRELDRVGLLLSFLSDHKEEADTLTELLMEMKDIIFTLQRSKSNALSIVELYEIKVFLLLSEKLEQLFTAAGNRLPAELKPISLNVLLDVLDPGMERVNAFYLYNEFSERLAELRGERREKELALRREQKQAWKRIAERYGIEAGSKNELVLSKSDIKQKELLLSIPELAAEEEDYISMTFRLRGNEEMFALRRAMEELSGAIEQEELRVREELSAVTAQYADRMAENAERVGSLDLLQAKAVHAHVNHCVRPVIVKEHVIDITDGRHLSVERILKGKGKEFCPISLRLENGVSCITGANMGGKTISLKLAGLIALLGQYGLFVPCARAEIGLSGFMQILIGDSQSVQRGLSSFGGEMEELKEILDNSKEDSLLLIDEIASGTNPVEGLALTRSLIEYLNEKSYITLITTHFDQVTSDGRTRNLQVRGLADADFDKLIREIRYANRRQRIEIIAKYMDYRLYMVEGASEIPRDALNIAKMLGVDEPIIQRAKALVEQTIL